MCIVIDTNTLSSVFNPNSDNHHEFRPVFDWIFKGRGSIVYGGKKYIEEIGKYIGLFMELKKVNKAKYVSDTVVDTMALKAGIIVKHRDFDDQHLVGLLLVSRCQLICSLDQRAYPFFTHRKIFHSQPRPKIYSSRRNRNLLCNQYIAEVCLPCVQLNRRQLRLIMT